MREPPPTGRSVQALAGGFLAISVPVETLYSWQGGLTDPFYLVKAAGWALIALGAWRLRARRAVEGVALLAAGWGWLAANFWRAVADRFRAIEAGESLRLGSAELYFAGACLLVCVAGMIWALAVAGRLTRAS